MTDVPDLSQLGGARLLGGADLKKAVERAEFEAGWRCGGCRRRIVGVGFRLSRMRSVVEDGVPIIRKQSTYACMRDDCDHAVKMQDGSQLIEKVEYVWLDEQQAGPVGSAAVTRTEGPEDAGLGK